MKEFFGFGGYNRPVEGYMSWQHLAFVSSLVVIMTALAIIIGLRNKSRDPKQKNKIIMIAAILMDSFELFKIVLFCIRGKDPMA